MEEVQALQARLQNYQDALKEQLNGVFSSYNLATLDQRRMYEEMKERDAENLNAIENQSKTITNLQVKLIAAQIIALFFIKSLNMFCICFDILLVRGRETATSIDKNCQYYSTDSKTASSGKAVFRGMLETQEETTKYFKN